MAKKLSGFSVDIAENGYELRKSYIEDDPKKRKDMGCYWEPDKKYVFSDVSTLLDGIKDCLSGEDPADDEKPKKKSAMDKDLAKNVKAGLAAQSQSK